MPREHPALLKPLDAEGFAPPLDLEPPLQQIARASVLAHAPALARIACRANRRDRGRDARVEQPRARPGLERLEPRRIAQRRPNPLERVVDELPALLRAEARCRPRELIGAQARVRESPECAAALLAQARDAARALGLRELRSQFIDDAFERRSAV